MAFNSIGFLCFIFSPGNHPEIDYHEYQQATAVNQKLLPERLVEGEAKFSFK